MAFKEVSVKELKINPFSLIGDEWMLVTSGEKDKFNTMTASWGGLGVLWNKNAAFAFIRPQRYTFEFLENNDYYTLSFFSGKYKEKLGFCGRVSGRDADKVKECGFTPCFEASAPYFKEASLVLVCRKIYGDYINPLSFIDKEIADNYKNHDYHKMYVGEITKCLAREDDE